ncbi:hypothetical protein D0C36_11565 [Mucilaginibacter conchicola]|uniref:Uncharacterized protein n=1 Tax=Mucilaginibacter conchicola TaxID=2303333 RepID=A0A372NS42_9SPHI|nr:hypothetical protein D0C36_11565 [Mucilaginibacter conchicola]
MLLFFFIFAFSFPVSKKASGESGQNNGGRCVGKGIAILADGGPLREQSWGKILQPVVLRDLQGKGFVRQRSLFAV